MTLSVIGACCCSYPSSKTEDAGSTGIKSIKESTTSGNILIVADESFQPIIEAEIDAFEHLYPESKIRAKFLPGEIAIQEMLRNDSVRLAIATRRLNYSEVQALEAQQTTGRMSLLATDAIALIVHKDNRDSSLTYSELIDVLTGTITQWKDIRATSKLGDIQLVFDHGASSTVQFLQDSILSGKTLTEKSIAGKSNPEVLAYVGKTPNALGIIGVSWISDQDDQTAAIFKQDIRVVGIEKLGGCSYPGFFYQPYQAYIHQKCYPLTREVYAILREARVGLGTGFVAFLAADPGQRIIHKAGLVPERSITRVVRFPAKN